MGQMLWPLVEGVYYFMYSPCGLRYLVKEMTILQLWPVHARVYIKAGFSLLHLWLWALIPYSGEFIMVTPRFRPTDRGCRILTDCKLRHSNNVVLGYANKTDW